MKITSNKIKNYFKSIPGYIWILILIVIVGIFFRTYNFNDWLFLQGDQVRDARMTISSIDNGIGNLPLLGPRAGGTTLKLGPIFYYFQYISALIFQSDQPYVLAYPTLLFSILTIPLFYYLVRKYFTANWSVAMTAIFSFSYMLIDYSRYAWNPNATPFFIILFIVSILEIFSPKNKHKYSWTIAAAISFAVVTQLHFSAFVTLPIILMLSILFSGKSTRDRVGWKQVVIFLAIILVFYIPVILSDVMNNGANLKQFVDAIGEKSSSNSFFISAKKEAYYFGKNFLYMLSGYSGSIKLISIVTQIFILMSFIANILLLRKEKDTERKNFLLIILTFFSVFCFVYFPLNQSIDKSRFFLPLAPIPFIYLGLPFIYFSQYAFFNKYFIKIFSVLIIAGLLAFSLYRDSQWVQAMNISQNKTIPENYTFALKDKDFWWSWSHFQKIAAYMRDDCKERNISFLLSKSARDYSASIELAASYLAKDKNVHFVAHDLYNNTGVCFYFISQSSNDVSFDIKNNFILGKVVDLGNVSILRFNFPQNANISVNNTSLSNIDSTNLSTSNDEMAPVSDLSIDSSKNVRQFWRDVWPFLFNNN